MSGGEADGRGGIASTSKDEEDIFPIPPRHAYAIPPIRRGVDKLKKSIASLPPYVLLKRENFRLSTPFCTGYFVGT